ncbi:PrsW family intramembrane metalloprotease [Ktedonospora formicarum]|uniref:PrsW family intramembrane metalloprotease n=1 Tax=Ktedonospora formicarum TaxID=2778364 RepID=A0A8J3MVQ1_9CHLR|nr:PrsW family intramembrane metalloprotease [Ktedonospora formicarum]GHO49570.1 hypothetical protein KSX_77330 [Ktedonospora formicarum]
MSGISQSPHPPARARQLSWLRVLILGLLLFIVTVLVMYWTHNTNLYPTVIVIGNFLVPVVFVAFLYDHQQITSLTPEMIAKSFVMGGVLGVLGASILESLLLPKPTGPNDPISLRSGMIIALIEEGCKIAAVMLLARKIRHDAPIDGLLLGAAVGMGFAALESTGYAFNALIYNQGFVGASIVETVLRGLIAPFGHGTWTAVLGAVLFRESKPHRFRITFPVVMAFIFVVVLHGCWDGLPHTIRVVIPPGLPISLASIVISILGLGTLFLVYRGAEREPAVPET